MGQSPVARRDSHTASWACRPPPRPSPGVYRRREKTLVLAGVFRCRALPELLESDPTLAGGAIKTRAAAYDGRRSGFNSNDRAESRRLLNVRPGELEPQEQQGRGQLGVGGQRVLLFLDLAVLVLLGRPLGLGVCVFGGALALAEDVQLLAGVDGG